MKIPVYRKNPNSSDTQKITVVTVMILSFRIDRSEQTVQTQIRLLLAVWSGSTLFAIPSAPFGHSTLWYNIFVRIKGDYLKFQVSENLGITVVWNWNSIILILNNGSKRCRQNGKQCRPWSDCSSVWAGSTLFAQTCLSENLGSLR